jgi:hypothetical protein
MTFTITHFHVRHGIIGKVIHHRLDDPEACWALLVFAVGWPSMEVFV